MTKRLRGPSGAYRAALVLCAFLANPSRAAEPAPVTYGGDGHTTYGDWHADVAVNRATWRPGETLRVSVSLHLASDHLARMAGKKLPAAEVVALATAERTFDAEGWMRLPSDERMSTLLTPGGLAIEGGVQGAVTDRFGYRFRSPFDVLGAVKAASLRPTELGSVARFTLAARLPADLPPGLYRIRLDFGARSGGRTVNLNGYGFTTRPFSDQAGTDCYLYSPGLFPASGTHASGRAVDATALVPRVPWTLLSGYGSNGYRGVVADEDRGRFELSDRNLIHDEVVLPLYDDKGSKLAYSLEPQVPPDGIDPRAALAWRYGTGELSVTIHAPDGSVTHVGTAGFVAKSGLGMTTKSARFTAWKPPMYGLYTVEAKGWMADATGRRYDGGGTYRFWIAKRMTMATATFQGMAYPVGTKYGRDIGFAPAVPADVTVTATLYPDSDAARARSLTYSGRASSAGVFGAAQGMKAFPLDAPGEYHARILATYTDAEGHLWVCVMRHAGVVYPEDSPIEAHGKKLLVEKAWVERGETHDEGFSTPDGEKHLQHITFPYRPGDVLLIASEGQGSNKIEPVLTWDRKGEETPWDPKLQPVGVTNLGIRTSNGYSPHLYPEYVTGWEYYYGAGPRPGFMSRFLVGESNVRAPYWPTSPNSFGGQIGASANGDQPGDIYRLLGGVVRRPEGEAPQYAGYIASAFILPKGTNNNRVVAPGSEDVIGSLGESARFFLVGLRPGMAYEVGSTFAPGLQIDPILPVAIRFTLRYPDGRTKVAEGTGDRFGSFAGAERWPLDVPGVYRYTIEASWEGHCGGMPGLPPDGGEMYVYRKERPAGARGLALDLPNQSRFAPTDVLRVSGTSTARSVRCALITPGAVIEQGDLPVESGRFAYHLDPLAVHAKVPLYDVVNLVSGKPEIGRVLHLTLFSEERAPDGTPYHDFLRVIVRGTQVMATR